MRFLQATAKKRPIQCREVLIETLQFAEPFPLRDQCLRADNEHRGNVHACSKFSDDEASLDGLPDADFVSNQQPGAIRADEFQHGTVLIRDELDAAGAKREQVSRRRRQDL